jgi:outer membrane protein TolC
VRIVPTDIIIVPEPDDTPALAELTQQGLANRADLAQAAIQVKNTEITVKASRNAVNPEIDLMGEAATLANIGSSSTLKVAPPVKPTAIASGKESHLYEGGFQLNAPIRNRVAQVDAARDEIQLRQMQGRLQQLENQIRDEISTTYTALEVSRSAYVAAVRTRQFQEQLLDAEMQKLSVGASTNFMIVQDEGYLAQARSTEVVARSNYIKSRVSLERAIGTLLESHNIKLDDSIRNDPDAAPPAAFEPKAN